MVAEVFLSYKRAPDRTALVRRLAHLLRNHSISVWWDHGLESGAKFANQIEGTIESATIVIPLWCSQSIYSTWVLRESNLAQQKLMPVRLQDVPPPADFAHLHAADLIGWTGDVRNSKLVELIRLIHHRLQKEVHVAPDTIEELASLPNILPLPPFDAKADALLQRFRNNYLKQDVAYTISDALMINLDSPLSDLVGGYETPDEAHDQLCEFCDNAADSELIWRTEEELFVYPDEMEGMTTLGELINCLVRAQNG